MKWTIAGFQQAEMVEAGMDALDAEILRWLVDFAATGKMLHRTIGQIVYYWVQYQAILDDLPILRLTTKDALAVRMKRMADAGILSHQTVREGGVYSFYGFGPRYEGLIRKLSTSYATPPPPFRCKTRKVPCFR